MRADEDFIKNVIEEKYLSKYDSYKIIDGNRNHPPDYRVMIGSNEYLLEVTQCTSIAINDDKSITSTNNIDIPILNIEVELNEDFKKYIMVNKVFILSIKGPIEKLNSFKIALKKYIKTIIENNEYEKYFSFSKIKIRNEEIELKVRERKSENDKMFTIFSWIKSKNHEYDIEEHIRKALTNTITSKHEKLKNLQGTKWLGILNDYFLASLDTYKRALNSGIEKYDFEIIFIVDRQKNLLPYICG